MFLLPQPLSYLLAHFSDSGKFTSRPLKIVNDDRGPKSGPRNVTLVIGSDSGKVKPVGSDVKLDLYFLDKWILISEVTFKTSDVNATLVEDGSKFESRAVTLFTFSRKEFRKSLLFLHVERQIRTQFA